MQLVCHIGTPKTASTFLQNTFAENAAWLRRHGIIYPDLMSHDANHITLFYAAHEGLHHFAQDYGLHSREDVLNFKSKMKKTLEKRVRGAPAGVHTMLVSSENLIGNLKSPQEVQNLGDLLKPYFDDIKIVVYLRRQDAAILSMYGEFMRRGFNSMTFRQFALACLGPQGPTHYLYYRRMLEMWINVFGQEALDVRLFERSRLNGGDVLSDFMSQILKTPYPDLSEMTRSSVDNIGLSAPALEFLRRMHTHIPYQLNGQVNPVRARLAPKIARLPAIPRPCMSPLMSRKIMKHFQPANNWLARSFFPHVEGELFPEGEKPPMKGNLGKITRDQFAEYTGLLLT